MMNLKVETCYYFRTAIANESLNVLFFNFVKYISSRAINVPSFLNHRTKSLIVKRTQRKSVAISTRALFVVLLFPVLV